MLYVTYEDEKPTNDTSSKQSVCIYGFGRLGSTLADLLGDAYDVGIYDIDPQRAGQARSGGYQAVSLDQIRSYSTVILCVPINTLEIAIDQLIPHLDPHAIVMDTCSVKIAPSRIMQEKLPDTVSLIASHPLFGPDSVKRGLDTLAMVIYPLRISSALYTQWLHFWQSLGLNVIEASPDEHDHVTAYTLGMTHFFGRIMDQIDLQPQAITTVSYNALCEVMLQTNRDSWELFRDMQHYNPYAKEMRGRVYQAIAAVEAKLDEAIDDEPEGELGAGRLDRTGEQAHIRGRTGP